MRFKAKLCNLDRTKLLVQAKPNYAILKFRCGERNVHERELSVELCPKNISLPTRILTMQQKKYK